MIFTDRTITVKKGTGSIDNTIVLYRGDKEVEIRFTLNESSPFKFGSGSSSNIIEKTEAAYGQLVIKTPNDLPAIFSEVVPTNEGKIVFTITAEMIDEITEVGNYTFQIRLFDESMNSRATLPEVVDGIEIREPIATEDVTDTNEVGVATVGHALTTAGTTEDAFDTQGNYNKTTWGTGDRITAAKLNKIEAGIDGVNKKVASAGTGGTVDLSGYVTKETGNANQITFADGQTFQAKLDAGTLKGDKGDKGEQGEVGAQGAKGDKGDDGVTTSIVVNGNTYTHVDGVITLPDYPTNVTGGEIVAGGGLTSTAQTLLISILRSAVFTSDQSTNIALLQSELAKGNSGGDSGGGSETTRYTITNTLNNATTSNSAVLVDANSSYTAIIRENDGYTLETITVTMGGTDITNTAVSGTTITIAAVTGNVVITVTTTQSSGGGTQELPTDGLLAYFDLRNVTQESGSGGSYVINATQGSGMLYSWYGMTATDDYGTSIKQSSYSNTTSTTSYDLGSEFTAIFKGYGGIFIDNNYFGNSNTYFAQINAYYKNTSGSPVKTNVGATKAGKNTNTYNTLIMRVLNNTLDIYINGSLDTTLTGSDYSDFSSWVGQLTPQLIYNEGYATAFAVYNKALSETEIVDLEDYLSTLEVK